MVGGGGSAFCTSTAFLTAKTSAVPTAFAYASTAFGAGEGSAFPCGFTKAVPFRVFSPR